MVKAIRDQTTHPRLPLLEPWWEDYLGWKKGLFEAEALKYMALHHQDTAYVPFVSHPDRAENQI
jgi:hypothetical protein